MQHYTRNTTEVRKWCPTCNRQTMHAVHDRRVSHCLEHTGKERAAAVPASTGIKCPYPKLCAHDREQRKLLCLSQRKCPGNKACDWSEYLQRHHIQDVKN